MFCNIYWTSITLYWSTMFDCWLIYQYSLHSRFFFKLFQHLSKLDHVNKQLSIWQQLLTIFRKLYKLSILVKIKQLTYPIEFGGNATFLCSSNQSSLIGRCTWKINSTLIARDRTTVAQHSKYIPTLHVNDTGVYYRLLITDFNSSDVNSLYRCDIDFDSQELFLSLNEDGFICK